MKDKSKCTYSNKEEAQRADDAGHCHTIHQKVVTDGQLNNFC